MNYRIIVVSQKLRMIMYCKIRIYLKILIYKKILNKDKWVLKIKNKIINF